MEKKKILAQQNSLSQVWQNLICQLTCITRYDRKQPFENHLLTVPVTIKFIQQLRLTPPIPAQFVSVISSRSRQTSPPRSTRFLRIPIFLSLRSLHTVCGGETVACVVKRSRQFLTFVACDPRHIYIYRVVCNLRYDDRMTLE